MSTELKELVGDLPTVDEEQVVEGEPSEVSEEAPETKEAAPAAPEQTQSVPLPIVMELKHDLRDIKQENLQLKQQLQALQTHQAPPEVEKDPLEEHVESYRKQYYEENGEWPDRGSVPVPADVILARDQWRERQSQKTSAQMQAQIRANALQVARTSTMTDAVFGEGLGIDNVVAIGEAFLTEGDKLDIQNAGEKCAEVMYRRCYDRAAQSGTPQGIALAQRMRAKLNPKPTVKEPPKQPEAPTVDEVLERPQYRHLSALGLVG